MDQPSYKKPLTLALILAAVSSLVYWNEYSKKPKEITEKDLEKKVLPLKDASVRKIRLVKEGQDLVFECTSAKDQCKVSSNSQWVLQEPLKAKADSSNVQSLLGTVVNLGGNDTVSLREESAESRENLLKSYHLDAASRSGPAARKVIVTDDGGKTSTAYIGEQAPTANAHYALAERDGKVNENLVFLVPKHQVAAFDQTLTHWRDKRIVTFAQNEITAFELNSKVGGRVVAEKATGAWDLVDGDHKVSADLDTIDTFLSGAIFLNAKNFIAERKDDAAGKAALKGFKEEASVKFKTEKASQTLRLWMKTFKDGKKEATIAYATVDELDPVFEVDTSSVDRVKKKASDFRQKKLLAVNDRGDVRFLRFTIPGKKPIEIAARLEGSEWKRVGEGKPILNVNVNAFLDRISGSVVSEFLPDQGAPAGALTVEMGASEKDLKKKLQFWKIGKKVYARDPGAARKETLNLVDSAADVLPFEETVLTAPRAVPSPAAHPPGDGHGHED